MIFFKITNINILWYNVSIFDYDYTLNEYSGNFAEFCEYISKSNDIVVGKNVISRLESIKKHYKLDYDKTIEYFYSSDMRENVENFLKPYNQLDNDQILYLNRDIYGCPGSGKSRIQEFNYKMVNTYNSYDRGLSTNYYISNETAAFINECVFGKIVVKATKSGNRPLILINVGRIFLKNLPFEYHCVYIENDIKPCENMVLFDPYLIKAMFYVTNNLIIFIENDFIIDKKALLYAKIYKN